MKVAAILFVLFGAFFELLFSRGNFLGSQYAFPALLILLGGYLVISRSGLFGSRKSEDETSTPEIQQ